MLATRADYAAILLNQTALIDVRAPVEFGQGAIPNSINLPIMTDQERHDIGLCYKQHGAEKATQLGFKRVSGEIKQDRVAAWKEAIFAQPNSLLYCFRGGQRSQITQQWLADEGIEIALIQGGYKAFRRFLLEILNQAAAQPKYMLGGMTGTGKTRVLQRLARSVDLEGVANHRGSSFGRQVTPQPVQVNFENQLAARLLRLLQQPQLPLCFEDEGRMIGSVHLPLDLFASFSEQPLVYLEASCEERVAILRQEYIDDMYQGFVVAAGNAEQGFVDFSAYLANSLNAIIKRLGHQRYQQIRTMQQQALQQQQSQHTSQGHESWLAELLTHYYDPMYLYQLEKKKHRIVFRGDRFAVNEYLQDKLTQSLY